MLGLCWFTQKESHSVVLDSLWSHGPYPTRLLCPWKSPNKNSEVGCDFLLQVFFPSQVSCIELSLLHLEADSLPSEPQSYLKLIY